MCWWPIRQSSAPCSEVLKAWSVSGRTLPWPSEALLEKRRSMVDEAADRLELDDIQRGVLSPRPAPYAATYILLRIDDRDTGRELMRRASAVVPSAAATISPAGDAWISVALTL